MISELLPKKKRYITTSNIFNANFNTAVGNGLYGRYNFLTDINATQDVLKYKAGTVYLLERVSVGGNLPEEIFFDSIESTPILTLKNKIGNEVIFEKPILVSGYKKNEDITTYLVNQKDGDILTCNCSGILKQVTDTVGVPVIRLFVQFSIFALDQNDFNKIYNTDKI